MTVLTEVTCRGCEKDFFIRSDDKFTDLCHPCVVFEAAMQNLMNAQPPVRKKPHPFVTAFLWTVIVGGLAIVLVLRWM